LNAQKAVRIVSSKFKISTKKWYILWFICSTRIDG
jgi:hypothetical protein